MKTVLLIMGIIALIALAYIIYRRYIDGEDSIFHLPLQELGYHNIPAFPFSLEEALATLLNLLGRDKEIQQAKLGLSKTYTLKHITANAYSFLFGGKSMDHRATALSDMHKLLKGSSALNFKNAELVKSRLSKISEKPNSKEEQKLTKLSLDKPEQYALAWTTYGNVLRDASEHILPIWSKSLTDVNEATQQFFPTIAKYGAAYNLIILEKATGKNIEKYKKEFQQYWTVEMDTLYQEGNLYFIDLTIYKMLEVQQKNGFDRFTPATFTWLKRDSQSKAITPFAIYVSGHEGSNAQFYDINEASDYAWLYALQAVKVSVTVYGIWYGHVYHWHVITASMVMTMLNNIQEEHVLHQLLAPQSKYIIGFNDVLLVLWEEIAPPTSIKTGIQFLDMTDAYAKDRPYFADDPLETIKRLGLSGDQFKSSQDWDQYPIVGYLLKIWDIVEQYVDGFVNQCYPTDISVRSDTHLQQWIKAAADKCGGNIQGLPNMDSTVNLKRVLRSLLYRISAHGISRMNNSANPALSFVANFPPCLQRSLIPEPQSTANTEELLKFLPNTGTIGEMVTFYYTFINSAPYEPMVPITGLEDKLFFTGEHAKVLNKHLVTFRENMVEFIEYYTAENKIPNSRANEAQIHQWPLNVET